MAKHATALDELLLDESFNGILRFDEPMARHTSYRIGGPASVWAEPADLSSLAQLVRALERDGMDWTVVGKGSNLLVADAGFDGAVVSLVGDFRTIRFYDSDTRVVAGGGASLPRLVQDAFRRGLTGMEFAVGTPGSVGGAVVMNAGTAGDWIGTRVVSVTTWGPQLGLQVRSADAIDWGYRHTSLPAGEVVVEAELQLQPGDAQEMSKRMRELLERRKGAQPLEYPSCGSVFRNPDGASAGALVDQAGLKGVMCGGAQVSEKHANFIVNKSGSASAEDVRSLICKMQETVKKEFGIELETEVRFLGFGQ